MPVLLLIKSNWKKSWLFFCAVCPLHPEIAEIIEFVWFRAQESNMSEVEAEIIGIYKLALLQGSTIPTVQRRFGLVTA